jgi:hypothetical protein
MALNGTVSLNNVTEKQLTQILQFKLAHEGQISFNPTSAKINDVNKLPYTYSQVVIGWTDDAGMKAAIELLSALKSE